MDNLLKDACTHELRNLLTIWNGLRVIKATQKDYAELRLKIFKVCDMLDVIEKQEKVHHV